jgi:hypothetical protein
MSIEKVSEKEKTVGGMKYPYVAKNSCYTVVLFVSPRTGIVISAQNSTYKKGEFITDWFEDLFTPFEVTIEFGVRQIKNL